MANHDNDDRNRNRDEDEQQDRQDRQGRRGSRGNRDRDSQRSSEPRRHSRRRGGGRRRRKEDYFYANNVEPNYKDVETLKRFMTERWKIRPRRQTGLTSKNQRRVATEIKRARHLALLPFTDEQTRD